MRIVEVIPIARSPFVPETLTYFSTKDLQPGDLVSVSLGGRNSPAAVKKVEDARALKSELKRGAFKLKPIRGLISKSFFDDKFLKAVSRISEETLLPQGLILFFLVPHPLFSAKLAIPPSREFPSDYHQESVFRGNFTERTTEYRSQIREHFARERSLIVVSPRLETLSLLERELGRGIENYVFSFTSRLAPKKYLKRWNEAIAQSHPVLILGTGPVLFFDRPDLESVILEEESSPFWRAEAGLDFRRVASLLAREKKRKLLLADELLRIETIWRAERGLVETQSTLSGRVQSGPGWRIINHAKREKPFSWIADEAASILRESVSRKEKILIFTNRKGAGSFTLCADCGRAINCPNCSVPLVLHLSGAFRKFLCHHCLEQVAVNERCPACGSWKLKDFGLGLEKVALEFKKLFPPADVFRLEREEFKNKKLPEIKNAEVVAATELIFSYPEAKFDLVFIPSLDYLFTIPDFRMRERIFRLLHELKNKTSRKIILQTRMADTSFLSDALSGNFSKFWQDEIKEREALAYPPFSSVIKLSSEDSNLKKLQTRTASALKILKAYRPYSFPAFIERMKNKYRRHIILKLAPEAWPGNQKLAQLLKSLRPAWRTVVDPETLL